MCVWLGGLASYREGLIGRLLRVHGDVPALLSRDSAALATELRRSRPGSGSDRARQPPPSEASAKRPGEVLAASEAAAFQQVLNLEPLRYLELMTARGPGREIITWCDNLYPPALRHLADPPLCLFLHHQGSSATLEQRLASLAERHAVAVVGTRAPSVYGEEMATQLGRDLTLRRLVVVSGLAIGIDAAAQAAALSAGTPASVPATVAVLGCGPDVVYPKTNASLRTEISRRGLLVSEFAWGVTARPWRFPARNRIMAALAHAVVVVEGSERSGARLTADFALDLGREVLAVPGEAGRRLSAAPHSLLRQGASLCESADDVLAALQMLDGSPCPVHVDTPAGESPAGERTEKSLLLHALDAGPMTVDHLARRCALPVAVVAAVVAELEVDGLVCAAGRGSYRRVRR